MTRPAYVTPDDLLPAPHQVSAAPSPALRICHVMSADLWAGAEVQVATMAAYQARQSGVSVSAVLFNDGPLARELRRLGVPVTIIDETRTGALGIVSGLTRFFREHRIDLVHTHRYKDSVLGALAAKLVGVPHVVRTVHGLREPMAGWSAVKFRVYEALDRAMLLFFADLVIAVSRGMADTLRQSGYRPTSLTQIHNGIDLSAIAPRRRPDQVRREFGIPPQALVIGTAGRLSPVKGHAALLRAARLIQEHQPDAIFLIVGGGPLADQLHGQAVRLGIASACVFPGAREDVHDLIAAMDIFVLPSLSEGIPMAMLEAMALGKPVVASAVGGVPEVVQDQVNGRLVPPGDEQRLADACVQLARDHASAQMLGVRARRTVEERFSHEQSGRALIAAYRSVALVPTTRNYTHEGHEGYEGREDRNHGGHDEYDDDEKGVWLRALRILRVLRVCRFCWGSVKLLAARGSGRIARWWTMLAMARIRRNPARIASRLRSARSVLILCHGNIIRSAFAARVVKAALNGRSRVHRLGRAGGSPGKGRGSHGTADSQCSRD